MNQRTTDLEAMTLDEMIHEMNLVADENIGTGLSEAALVHQVLGVYSRRREAVIAGMRGVLRFKQNPISKVYWLLDLDGKEMDWNSHFKDGCEQFAKSLGFRAEFPEGE